MLLIATDEAGYGPKLGPLVITATTWQIPDATHSKDELTRRYEPIAQAHDLRGTKVVVNDSKAVYKPKPNAKLAGDRLGQLHAIVSVANQICQHPIQVDDWLAQVTDDMASILATPWLQETSAIEFLRGDDVADVASRWTANQVDLIDVKTRVITAAKFNEACDRGMNKADLLSESTLGLVRDLIQRHGDGQPIKVFCDRHGGRRYYAGVLQHLFADSSVQVCEECKSKSTYRMTSESLDCDVDFSVKGDSFTPVALSSIIAKYTRERMMEAFNCYFGDLYDKHQAGSKSQPLCPTAGYPTDASRFLSDIESIITAEKIDRAKLIRQR